MPNQISDSLVVEQIMEHIQERVRMRKEGGDLAGMPPATKSLASSQEAPALAVYDLAELRQNVAATHMLWNAVGTINPRPPGWRNELIQLAKKGIRRLLTWYTRPLHQFNSSVTRSLNETMQAMENLQTYLAAIHQRLETLQHQLTVSQASQDSAIAALGDRLTQLDRTLVAERKLAAERLEAVDRSRHGDNNGLREQVESALEHIEQLRGQEKAMAGQLRKLKDNRIFERLSLSERNIRRLTHMLEEKGQALLISPQPNLSAVPSFDVNTPADIDYFWFEERFRGDEAEIKERQRTYVDCFRGCQDVLDLGCGRGEFLELLRESGIPARGVDINTDMVLLCREKGLEVVQEDLFHYLESVPDQSVDGIFCAQVIEHLTPAQLMAFVQITRRKLRPGAPLVAETINPECLFVYARALFLDPSHLRPIHPWTMSFLMESTGYNNIELKYLSPVDQQYRIPPLPPELVVNEQVQRFNQAIGKLNELLYGHQDYAVIGRR